MRLLKSHALRAKEGKDPRIVQADKEYQEWLNTNAAENACSGIRHPGALLKSHIRQHERHNADGSVTTVSEHEDNRQVHYHAGADVPTHELRPGTFTTPDRAAAEQFARAFGHPKIHEMHINDLGKKTATEKEIKYYAKKVGIFEKGTPVGQYFERDLWPEGRVQKLVTLLGMNGFTTAKFDDGMSKHPSTVVLWSKTIEPLTKARPLQGSIDFKGLPISIETGRSRSRQWYDPHNDTQGISRMSLPYGYIRGTKGTDGDQLDVIVGPDRQAPEVYVVHINKAPNFTEYDEDKCFIGLGSPEEAMRHFRTMYDKPEFFGSMSIWPFDEFKEAAFSRKGERLDNTKYLPADESPNGIQSGPARLFTEGELREWARRAP